MSERSVLEHAMREYFREEGQSKARTDRNKEVARMAVDNLVHATVQEIRALIARGVLPSDALSQVDPGKQR